MSVQITKYPRIQKTADPLEISRWQAVHQEIVYVFQRKDYQVNAVTNQGGQALVDVVTDTDPITEIVAGQYIYLNSGNYVGSYLVDQVIGTTLKLTASYVGNATGGYLNATTARANYYLELQVLTPAGISWAVLGTTEEKPSATGEIRASISTYLRAAAYLEDDCTYGKVNEKQPGLGQRYNVRYRERWTGKTAGDYSTINAVNNHYWVNGAKQIQQQYGANMAEYVTFPPDVETPIEQHSLAKFLCPFNKPTRFEGFPFSLTFIYSENIAEFTNYRKEETKDVNGALLSSASTQLLSSERLYVNALQLAGGYGATVKEVDVWLECDRAEQELFTYYEGDTVEAPWGVLLTYEEYIGQLDTTITE